MAKKRKPEAVNTGAWLNTYADMVTLILTFFVLLYSMSTIDAQKYAKLAQALSNGNNVITAPDDYKPGDDLLDDGSISETPVVEDEDLEGLDVLYRIIMNYVNENNLQEDIIVEKTEEEVFLRFRNNVFFDGYSSELKMTGKEILDVVALGIKEAEPVIQEIIIAGHTAMVESDPTDIDRSLSSNRANAVLLYLESKELFEPDKLVAVGYGLHRPIATNDTAEGRAQNRRVEIYISKKGYEKSFTDYIYDLLSEREKSKTNIEE